MAAWALAVAAAVATGSRWADVASSSLALTQSLSPLAAPVALVALGAVLLPGSVKGRAALTGVCLLVLCTHAAIWVPWLTEEAPRRGRGLTVMALNLYRGRADLAAVSREVRAEGVDVLVLTEVTAAATARLRRYGVHRELPHAVPDRRTAPPGGTVIRSRLPMTGPGTAKPLATAELAHHPAARLGNGQDIVVRAVHPAPPVRGRVRQWRATLRDLTEWAARTRGPLIVAGDFNASIDHPGMRELLATGLRDAHEVAGAGRPRTWPHGRSVPAFVHIDHVLVRGIDVDSAEEVRIAGSDHDAVVVALVVPHDATDGPQAGSDTDCSWLSPACGGLTLGHGRLEPAPDTGTAERAVPIRSRHRAYTAQGTW